MQFDTSLLVPTLWRTRDMGAAIPGTVAVWVLGVAVLGLLADVASRQPWANGSIIWLVYGAALTAVQIWITAETLVRAGARPALSLDLPFSLYWQSLLVWLGILLGLLLLVLPGLYVAARCYLSGTVLILHGGGATAAISRSWDMLGRHWPTAFIIGLMMALLSAAPLMVGPSWSPLTAGTQFALLFGLNLVSAIGIVGGFLAAVALLLHVEPPTSVYREIFS